MFMFVCKAVDANDGQQAQLISLVDKTTINEEVAVLSQLLLPAN